MPVDTYRELLAAAARELTLDPEEFLRTEELVFDGLVIGLTYDGDEDIADVVFFARLGAPAPADQARVYATLLEANSLWVGTGGATLAVHGPSQQVLICGRIPVEGTTPQGLVQVLDVFTEAAQFWQDFVARPDPAGPAPADPPGLVPGLA